MSTIPTQKALLEAALTTLVIPASVGLRTWQEEDFPTLQRLAAEEGWSTYQRRPEESLLAWKRSWPALILTGEDGQVIGFVRGITDGEITMYIAELLVAYAQRGKGLGRLLLDTCHALYPHARLDLVSSEEANGFYKAHGFRLIGEGLRKSYR